MLKSIDIKGLAVVEQLNLELEPGMTVLTGETGAGKSILLTAMKLCLGERADANLIRPGVKKADISLDFDINNMPLTQEWLNTNELDDQTDCLIRRTISEDGRSRAFINGQPVNLKTLQQLSQHLISIHGQHAHLDLLHPINQCLLLDNYVASNTALSNCQQLYTQWKRAYNELLSLTDGNDDNDSEKQLLIYQIQELEQTDLIHLHYDTLTQEHALASNASKIIELAEKQVSTLYEDDNGSIHTQLSRTAHELESLTSLDSSFGTITEQINDALIQIQEAGVDLRHKVDQQEDDPKTLLDLDNKISKIHELSRKLNVNPSEIKDKYTNLVNRLKTLENRNERLDDLQTELSALKDNYIQSAKKLHVQRCKTAKKLSSEITKTLKTLGLPEGNFEIDINYKEQENPTINGFDNVNFLVTTNPGMPASPINKVASGGELSRLSLAIQVVTSQSNTIPTLVFDEVDAGIGGGVAETVGICLREIAINRQVICVTHLPQVASQGHHHLFISKDKNNGQTSTKINRLSKQTRTEEIARMLGGVDMSDKTIAHAQEMLEKANR